MAKKKYGRNIKTCTKYKVWCQYKGHCAFCYRDCFFIDNEEHNNKNFNKRGYNGELAHIVSASKDNDVRPNNIESKIMNKYVVNIDNDNQKNKYFNKVYTEEFLTNENNLILLCFNCHKKFDLCKNCLKDKNEITKKISEIINTGCVAKESQKPQDWENHYQKIVDFLTKKKQDISTDDVLPFVANTMEDLEEILNFLNELGKEECKDFKFSVNVEGILNDWDNWKPIYELLDDKLLEDKSLLKLFDDNSVKNVTKNIKDFNHRICFKIIKEVKKVIVNFSEKDRYNLREESKTKEQLYEKINQEFENDKELEKINIVSNISKDNDELKNKPEYKQLKKILLDSLRNYASNESIRKIDSFSIAYLSSWGTGKTSLIKTLAKDLKDYFYCIEINLWSISSSFSENQKFDHEDNIFVRLIVKKSITQLINDPELVEKYIDSNCQQNQNKSESDAKKNILKSLTTYFDDENISTFKERNKFLDQFIASLQNIITTLFNFSKKPTLFVLDDLDRINDDEKIVQILDALISFLDLNNCIYIIPIDEHKVLNAIQNKKPNYDAYQYFNKYFNYSIKSSSIPKIESFQIFKNEFSAISNDKINDEFLKIIVNYIDSSYRTIKDFINKYEQRKYIINRINSNNRNTFLDKQINVFLNNKKKNNPKEKYFKNFAGINLNENEEKEFLKQYFLITTLLMQIKFPWLIQYVTDDIGNLRKLLQSNNYNESIKNIVDNHSLTNKNKLNDEKDNNIKIDSIVKEYEDFVDKFKIEYYSNEYLISFWLTLTMVNLSNDNIKCFFELRYIFDILLDFNDNEQDFDNYDDWENDFVKFIDEIENFYKLNFIEKEQYKEIINLFFNKEFSTFIKTKIKDIKKIKNLKLKRICNLFPEIDKGIAYFINIFHDAKYIDTNIDIKTIEECESFINNLDEDGVNFLENNFKKVNFKCCRNYEIINKRRNYLIDSLHYFDRDRNFEGKRIIISNKVITYDFMEKLVDVFSGQIIFKYFPIFNKAIDSSNKRKIITLLDWLYVFNILFDGKQNTNSFFKMLKEQTIDIFNLLEKESSLIVKGYKINFFLKDCLNNLNIIKWKSFKDFIFNKHNYIDLNFYVDILFNLEKDNNQIDFLLDEIFYFLKFFKNMLMKNKERKIEFLKEKIIRFFMTKIDWKLENIKVFINWFIKNQIELSNDNPFLLLDNFVIIFNNLINKKGKYLIEYKNELKKISCLFHTDSININLNKIDENFYNEIFENFKKIKTTFDEKKNYYSSLIEHVINYDSPKWLSKNNYEINDYVELDFLENEIKSIKEKLNKLLHYLSILERINEKSVYVEIKNINIIFKITNNLFKESINLLNKKEENRKIGKNQKELKKLLEELVQLPNMYEIVNYFENHIYNKKDKLFKETWVNEIKDTNLYLKDYVFR